MQNGVLNFDIQELTPFDSKLYEINLIPVIYNPKADAQILKNSISEIVETQNIELLKEIVGYILEPDNENVRLIGERLLELLEVFLEEDCLEPSDVYDILPEDFINGIVENSI